MYWFLTVTRKLVEAHTLAEAEDVAGERVVGAFEEEEETAAAARDLVTRLRKQEGVSGALVATPGAEGGWLQIPLPGLADGRIVALPADVRAKLEQCYPKIGSASITRDWAGFWFLIIFPVGRYWAVYLPLSNLDGSRLRT